MRPARPTNWDSGFMEEESTSLPLVREARIEIKYVFIKKGREKDELRNGNSSFKVFISFSSYSC